MSLKIKITGTNVHPNTRGGIYEAHVHPFEAANVGHSGVVTLSKSLQNFTPNVIPFSNDLFGSQMNQNVIFGGTPELIHDGQAVGVWTPTANAGIWNFADSAKITITSANNNDSATFDDSGTIDMNDYTSITGKVDLDTYNVANHSIDIQFGLAGELLGNFINLNNYIDTGDFSEQGFVIPKIDFGINSLTIDEMTITIRRSGGSKPTVKFDDIQIEETGSPAVFKVFSSRDSDFYIKKLRFLFADALAGTLADGTMPALSYDKILGLSALTNGIVVQIIQNGEIDSSFNLKQFSDMQLIGADILSSISDGTNTFVILELEFSETVILKTNKPNSSFISITINDDLSGLLLFTGAARGAYEVIN